MKDFNSQAAQTLLTSCAARNINALYLEQLYIIVVRQSDAETTITTFLEFPVWILMKRALFSLLWILICWFIIQYLQAYHREEMGIQSIKPEQLKFCQQVIEQTCASVLPLLSDRLCPAEFMQ